MNQLQQYDLKKTILSVIGRLRDEIEHLEKDAALLPYCPCCPSPGGICLVDHLRYRDSAAADIEFIAAQTGVGAAQIKAAVDLVYTFTVEEFARLGKFYADAQKSRFAAMESFPGGADGRDAHATI